MIPSGSTAKFSEGEWWLAEDGRTVYAGRADEDAPGVYPWPGKAMVCEVWDTVEGLEGDDPVADANARLIAAAPDLLAALKGLCDWIDATDADETVYVQDAMAKARAAIAKAEGGGS